MLAQFVKQIAPVFITHAGSADAGDAIIPKHAKVTQSIGNSFFMDFSRLELNDRLWQPGDLGVLREVIDGFSEEARTRGFASLSFLRFAFVGCNYALCADGRIASIRGCT